MSLAVTSRTRRKDVPGLSSHFCHVCCGDKQEGIFNRRYFLCWSSKAQGWWPSRHSANPICFPWDEGYLSNAGDDALFDSQGQFILLLLIWICTILCFQVNCPWHTERPDIAKTPRTIKVKHPEPASVITKSSKGWFITSFPSRKKKKPNHK